ncbi:ferroxidase HEPHL1 isoform X2 [Erinaceus europaeus]|uniref:ferroxidase n=1 Tax=Erinaceus europaeus TaxID=9365 RepID=A0ABM3WGF6_ERIEU|nr:ferroxidase HEPHL1 isoform X2 [Erinaceus europaeus]
MPGTPRAACTLLLSLLLGCAGPAGATTRTYHIGVVEEYWDYVPQGKNVITGTSFAEDKLATLFLERGPNRIGGLYKKAVYRLYTDATYSTELPKPAWLGFLGPVLRAEVGDVVVVHLKNFASRPYSLHPHGVFYDKDSEGALYPDGTSGRNKKDDMVPPGKNYTYVWPVREEYAPTPADANCLTWVYHSHIDAPKDICSGLIGPLLVCKKGILNPYSGARMDVDREFVIMFTLVDENQSWYLDENIQHFCTEPSSVNKDDAVFQRSNKMHALNGFLFGNLPEPQACVGESVSWHLFGMGNEIDIHSIYFYGNTFVSRGHRTDVVNLFPATFLTADMLVENPGRWMITCQVSDHLQAGMLGQYSVDSCKRDAPHTEVHGQHRRYFIAAEKVLWNYAPLGYDRFSGQPLNASGSEASVYFTRGENRIGGTYWKAQYVEYVDATFKQRKRRTEAEAHLGILGPVIRAEVGDTLLVTFANKADRAYSILPHGVFYDKASDAAPNADGFVKPGAHVKPGQTFTYRWTVPKSVSPTAGDPPCLSYLYFSAVDPIKDTSSGLVGPLLVCKKGVLSADGTQKGVDREFHLLFTVFDENLSRYLDENIQKFSWRPFSVDREDKDFVKSNRMHAINGYMYGNQPGLSMCQRDRVSWHLMGMGTDTDMHGVYFQGNTLLLRGAHRDSLALFPHVSTTTFMQPDHAGLFRVFCSTLGHFSKGMNQMYEVGSCGMKDPAEQPYGMMRTFYIAAEEVEWDYAPNKNWEFEKQHLDAGGERHGDIFMNHTENWIGSQYKKVVYREYTNGEFVEIKARPPQEEHLELLGPMIHAEVGDSILIIFKNKAERPYSIWAHGVEAVDSGKQLQVPATKPGEIRTYRWNVPKRSGPGPSDPNCIPWLYYSTVDFVKDMYSGLMGPLITCREGVLNDKGRRSDVDHEFVLLFLVFNENESWYLGDNIKKYLNKDPRDFRPADDFEESNRMHAINGKIFGNLHGLVMNEDSMTNWYLLGLGSEVDIHTVHYHAESFLFKIDTSYREDVYDLFPGTFQTIELFADHPGTWLLHCHVSDHIHAGMETTYTVLRNTASFQGPVQPSHGAPQRPPRPGAPLLLWQAAGATRSQGRPGDSLPPGAAAAGPVAGSAPQATLRAPEGSLPGGADLRAPHRGPVTLVPPPVCLGIPGHSRCLCFIYFPVGCVACGASMKEAALITCQPRGAPLPVPPTPVCVQPPPLPGSHSRTQCQPTGEPFPAVQGQDVPAAAGSGSPSASPVSACCCSSQKAKSHTFDKVAAVCTQACGNT